MATGGKKDHVMPAFRVETEVAEQYYEALRYYGISRTSFARACMATLIYHHKNSDNIQFPIRLQTFDK